MQYARNFYVGKFGDDPRIYQSTNGGVVASFVLNVPKRGGKSAKTIPLVISAFGEEANLVERYGAKNVEALVVGYPEISRWQDKITGLPRSRLVTVAEEVSFSGLLQSEQEDAKKGPPRTDFPLDFIIKEEEEEEPVNGEE